MRRVLVDVFRLVVDRLRLPLFLSLPAVVAVVLAAFSPTQRRSARVPAPLSVIVITFGRPAAPDCRTFRVALVARGSRPPLFQLVACCRIPGRRSSWVSHVSPAPTAGDRWFPGLLTEESLGRRNRPHKMCLEFGIIFQPCYSCSKCFPQFRCNLRLHDDSANDDSAIDKMAARFWHTDDSATFLFEKKGQNFFPTPHGFHLKTFPTPHGCQKLLKLPLTGFFYPWRELIFSLKKLFLTPNWLQIGKNGLNWPSFFYVT